MSSDKLEQLFEMQFALQEITHPNIEIFAGDIQYLRLMALGAIEEISEILRAAGWKPWKMSGEFNYKKAKEEFVDLMHFVINMSFALDLKPSELFNM